MFIKHNIFKPTVVTCLLLDTMVDLVFQTQALCRSLLIGVQEEGTVGFL